MVIGFPKIRRTFLEGTYTKDYTSPQERDNAAHGSWSECPAPW